MVFFFLLAGNVLEPDSMMLIALSAFPNQYTFVLFCFLVKKILDTDLTMNSFPPVLLLAILPMYS